MWHTEIFEITAQRNKTQTFPQTNKCNVTANNVVVNNALKCTYLFHGAGYYLKD
jgi:hypothetical protein